MHIERLTTALPGEMSAGPVCSDPLGNPVFMFGTFDQSDRVSASSILALNEAIMGIRGDDGPVTVNLHGHAEVAAVEISGAFMFGVHPEQPPFVRLGELALSLWNTQLD
jgi:hypothetical protein